MSFLDNCYALAIERNKGGRITSTAIMQDAVARIKAASGANIEVVPLNKALEMLCLKGGDAPKTLIEKFHQEVGETLERLIPEYDVAKDSRRQKAWYRPRDWMVQLPLGLAVDYASEDCRLRGILVLARAVAAAIAPAVRKALEEPDYRFRKVRGGGIEVCAVTDPNSGNYMSRIFVMGKERNVRVVTAGQLARLSFFDSPKEMVKGISAGVFRLDPNREMTEKEAFERIMSGDCPMAFEKRHDFAEACAGELERLVRGFSKIRDQMSATPWAQPWKSGRKLPEGLKIDQKDPSAETAGQWAMGRAYARAIAGLVSAEIEAKRAAH